MGMPWVEGDDIICNLLINKHIIVRLVWREKRSARGAVNPFLQVVKGGVRGSTMEEGRGKMDDGRGRRERGERECPETASVRKMPFPGGGPFQGRIRSNWKNRSCSRTTPTNSPSCSTSRRRQRSFTILWAASMRLARASMVGGAGDINSLTGVDAS